MKGTYVTIQAKCVNVLEFDAVNKMAYTDFGEGDIHWVGEPEYKDWATPTYVPDTPAQMIVEESVIVKVEEPANNEEVIEKKQEVEKPKRTYKKKDK